MDKLPLRAKIYIVIIILLAIVMLLYLFTTSETHVVKINLIDLAVFYVITLFAELLPVTLPRGAKVSVGLAIWFTNIILFPPIHATIVTALAFFTALLFDKQQNLIKIAFNVSQVIITIAASSLTFQKLLYLWGNSGWAYYSSLAIIMLLCMFLNICFVMMIVALVEKNSLLRIWRENHKWEVDNFIALLFLGFFTSVIYKELGIIGVLLFTIPLFLARRSFQMYIGMRQAYRQSIESLAAAIDAKDKYTSGHSERVARYAEILAQHMGLPEERIEQLKFAALLHDTGKIGISEKVLNKPGRLDSEEFALMKKHPEVGANIIEGIKFLEDGYENILHHHERWDGKGYPRGLAGEDIPLGARIIAVADAFDAMTSDRPYRPALTYVEAYKEVLACSGSQFDPKVVDAFIKVFPDIRCEVNKVGDERELRYEELAKDTGEMLVAEGGIKDVY